MARGIYYIKCSSFASSIWTPEARCNGLAIEVLRSLLQTANLASPAWGEFVTRMQLTYCMVQMFICTLIHNITLLCALSALWLPNKCTEIPKVSTQNIRASPLRFSLPLLSWRWCHEEIQLMAFVTKSVVPSSNHAATLWPKVLPCGSQFLTYPAVWTQ